MAIYLLKLTEICVWLIYILFPLFTILHNIQMEKGQ